MKQKWLEAWVYAENTKHTKTHIIGIHYCVKCKEIIPTRTKSKFKTLKLNKDNRTLGF